MEYHIATSCVPRGNVVAHVLWFECLASAVAVPEINSSNKLEGLYENSDKAETLFFGGHGSWG